MGITMNRYSHRDGSTFIKHSRIMIMRFISLKALLVLMLLILEPVGAELNRCPKTCSDFKVVFDNHLSWRKKCKKCKSKEVANYKCTRCDRYFCRTCVREASAKGAKKEQQVKNANTAWKSA